MDLQSRTPNGDITTLLDLTSRDSQDAEFTPLDAQKTWWQPDVNRRVHPFSISVQTFPLRGPAAWGQRATFDVGSITCGDILLGVVLELDLQHWFDEQIICKLLSQEYAVKEKDLNSWWSWANSIGSVLIERAELEIGDQTVEVIDGDWITVFSSLYPDLNTQFGVAHDGLGRVPLASLKELTASLVPTRFQNTYNSTEQFWGVRPFPTEKGKVLVPLPFFFGRTRLSEGLPLLSIRDGDVRIHITFRKFEDCVRQYRGYRSTCDATPLGSSSQLYSIAPSNPISIPLPPTKAVSVAPSFKKIQLMTYAANTNGSVRQALLRAPHEILHRHVKIIDFSEPLVYTVNTPDSDSIRVQLPLEINDPVEEILWFVRRKATANNNEWTNFGAVLAKDIDPIFSPQKPLLQSATLQINGQDVISEKEAWFRRHIAELHKGGAAAYESYIYGYSFSKTPGEHQPNGTINASRANNIRLCLTVKPPPKGSLGTESTEWEVKVFVVSLQWLRFENGIANRMFQ